MRTLATGALITALLLAHPRTGTPAAHASPLHFHLVRSAPDKEVVLDEAPEEIKLWFSEAPQQAGTSIRLVGPGESLVEMAAAHRSPEDATLVSAEIVGTLRAGVNKVMWRAMGDDGHIVRGEYTFTLMTAKADARAP